MATTLGSGREWTDPTCPVARTVDLVGDRWSLLIVRDAMDGAATFTEFQQRLGIARNILTDRLRRLVDHGILATTTTPGGKRHSYRLTEAGQDLFTLVVALRQWGERHAFTDGEPHSTLVDRHGNPVAAVRAEGHDGRPVTAATTRVRKIE
ncbi:helix-turn-helix transcriptional regulator [Nocardia terpenica]|uniref:winged helix-turn-helix transcriptional regulator n=1 Tax=Nocardia terpenica TaxID=455432 RepID=UPI0018949B46|nr:helix-turn-helix domain-containing protein [Nocardia terpenica]MBF6064786.1 helix-turn-helix transcriptional regulator [Nocardia terpenica]MBF6107301.1 helix-turn-helix transcriptional regulator [Nocardia terpenica]MBF6115058.1 helix-turn-helix transcriptional regulator [Nocardia terpenica]MBF6122164.1 helix-turn-helix transcriptional regulator [Nocardia terpenica]MBF6154547.1 helix-turn-helix transcriptional regulator [Nocardia terpenica]